MGITTIKPESGTIWYIIYNEDLSVLISGSVGVGNTLSTGQPNVEQFDNENMMEARLLILEAEKLLGN